MNYRPTTAEQRLLWMLVANSGEGFNDDLAAEKNSRESLIQARLIEVEKRRKPSSKRKVPAMYLRLTDAGWAWCNQDMSWQKPRGKAEKFLNSLLQRLKTLFDRQGTVASLADFINNSTPAASDPPATAKKDAEATRDGLEDGKLDGRIRAACLELGGGREAVRIRIADLRKRLADVPNADLTEGIRELSRHRELTLFPLDDPRQITPEDEAAAIHSSTGVPQHILYYGGIAS
jgi:hypothetical protein